MGTNRPLIALLSAALAVPTGLAFAATPVAALEPTITVDDWADELNADGDCSLREAIETLNSGVGVDACAVPAEPVIDIPGGLSAISSTLVVTESMTIRSTSGFPASLDCSFVVGNCIENVGAGSDLDLETLWVSGASQHQVYAALGAGHLHLRDVNVWGGAGGVVSQGGEIDLSAASSVWDSSDWGVFSLTGDVTIDHSTLGGHDSGAVYADLADVAISSSAVYQNEGFGVFGQSGDIDIVNTTIARNGADATRTDDGVVTYRSSTIAENRRAMNVVGSGETRFSNTVVAQSDVQNCDNPVVSEGFNVSDDDTCAFDQPTDRIGLDPQLAIFDNTTLTASYTPLAGSPLVDTGGDCPTVDQLDGTRPTDGDGDGDAGCDVGSVETAGIPSDPDPTDPGSDPQGDPGSPTAAVPATPVSARPTFTG